MQRQDSMFVGPISQAASSQISSNASTVVLHEKRVDFPYADLAREALEYDELELFFECLYAIAIKSLSANELKAADINININKQISLMFGVSYLKDRKDCVNKLTKAGAVNLQKYYSYLRSKINRIKSHSLKKFIMELLIDNPHDQVEEAELKAQEEKLEHLLKDRVKQAATLLKGHEYDYSEKTLKGLHASGHILESIFSPEESKRQIKLRFEEIFNESAQNYVSPSEETRTAYKKYCVFKEMREIADNNLRANQKCGEIVTKCREQDTILSKSRHSTATVAVKVILTLFMWFIVGYPIEYTKKRLWEPKSKTLANELVRLFNPAKPSTRASRPSRSP